MQSVARLLFVFVLFFGMNAAFAGTCGGCIKDQKCQPCDTCCSGMGGISYCDSSAGRLVCNNGFYSSCYCTRHAVMDLTHIQGCCLWQGGVMRMDDPTGLVLCNNGGISEICSYQATIPNVATW